MTDDLYRVIGITLALAVFFALIDRLTGIASEDIANEPE